MPQKFANVDDYIQTFPPDVQTILKKIRATIRRVIPTATETISYQIPTFKVNGRYVVYFSGWKEHVSLYPIPKGSPSFDKQITHYTSGKGTVKFPLDKPIPYDLIKKIVKFRLQENANSK